MRLREVLVSFSALAMVVSSSVFAADGVFIPAPDRQDVAYDAKRNLVYISSTNQILRYDLTNGAFLAPVSITGGSLHAIDLSPYGDELAVADGAGGSGTLWFHTVDLGTLQDKVHATTTTVWGEYGTFAVVYGADGNIYTTSRFSGSGWVDLRQFNPATNAWKVIADVTQDTMLAPSGDRQTIAFAESNISDGRWGLYDVPTGGVVRRQWYTDGTSWFNYEIATDHYGAQFAIPTYGGTMVYDDAYQKVATFGVYAGEQPVGVAYHPVEELAYFPFVGTSQVRVYDMLRLTQVGAYDVGQTIQSFNSQAFYDGRTKLSADGSVLMVTVQGGVQVIRMYEPLSAAPVSASTHVRVPVAIPLAGSIGNGGSLVYAAASSPAHGSLVVEGSTATYTPASDFQGQDSFTYRVSYGLASQVATVTVDVAPAGPNHAPVAAADIAYNATSAIRIPVLVNDDDEDADPLTIIAVSAPPVGKVSIWDDQIRFLPPFGWKGPSTTFTYTISDGRGGTATAPVTVYTASAPSGGSQNKPPVATADTAVAGTTAIYIPVLANDYDPNGDALQLSAVTQPAAGSAAISGSQVKFTPAIGWTGPAVSFQYTVIDGKGGSATATVTVSSSASSGGKTPGRH